MDIYRKYEALSPIYQGGLTNHIPMVLVALKELGVTEEKIAEKLDNYRQQKWLFDLTDSNTPIDDFSQEYINRTGFYLGELNHKGEDIVVGEFINKNKLTISSGLFHGLIRLAYAKQVHHPLMIAQALAYYELTMGNVEFKATYIDESEFEESFSRLFNAYKELDYTFETEGTMNKLNEILTNELVSENLVYLKTPNRKYILDFILSHYLRTKDFYILHLVTGFEALLELEEYIYGFEDVLNHFFVLAQAFVLFNTSTLIEDTQDTKSLEELIKEVEHLVDFHDIKLFYSLVKLSNLFENKKINKIANQIFKK